MSQPTPLSLVFGPDFGAVHRHPDGEIRYWRDRLAGHIRVFKPVVGGVERTMFELGRHPSCWLRIGWESVSGHEQQRTNEAGYPLFGAISRVMVTFAWASEKDYPWISHSKWLVMPGGVFVGKDGNRESSTARNGVYLNGHRLSDGDNPETLFLPGQNQAFLSLGKTGRIIIIDGSLDEHSTGWPAQIWAGANWPDGDAEESSADLSPQRLQIEGQVAAAKNAHEVTGRTMADLAAIVLYGPDGVDARLWWVFCGVVGAVVLWILKR